MHSYVAKPTPPNQDKRWKLVDATIRRQGQQARGLIETLHTVQEAFGYLDEQALRYVAMSLRVPLSRAYGVATFYHFFTLKPAGEHTCVICMGTACYIKGAPQLLDAVQKRSGNSSPGNHGRQEECRCSRRAAWDPADWLRPSFTTRRSRARSVPRPSAST